MIAKLMLALTLVGMTMCHRHYMDSIPHGHNVPNPCTGGIWEGVGHTSSTGAGERNQFGLDFAAHNHHWLGVCHLDSDGDGMTNGEELGDPNCVWAPGHGHGHPPPAPQGPVRGHPGICEPTGSAQCANAWHPC